MSRRGPGVVVDTNLWMHGLLMSSGPRAELVRQVLRLGQPVFSAAAFAELKQRLWLPKFDRYVTLEHRKRLLHDIDGCAMWVEVAPEIAGRAFCRNAADDKFIHAALAAGAAWVVTGSKDLLAAAEGVLPHGVHIAGPTDALLSPEFLRRV